jgi:pimeloyl-ACP methyl ester carboxylesterase
MLNWRRAGQARSRRSRTERRGVIGSSCDASGATSLVLARFSGLRSTLKCSAMTDPPHSLAIPHPAPPNEVTLDVRGLSVAARAWGGSGAPPLLALHGWLDNAASFDALAPLLPELGFLALDCPGHGHSEHLPLSGSYDIGNWLALPFSVADHFGWERFTLMGHSMGAAISALSAGVCPERIERLVLIEGLGPFTARDEEAPLHVQTQLARERRRQRAHPRYPTLEAAAARLASAVPGLSLAGALRLVERGTRALDGGFTWRADPRLRAPSGLPFTEARVQAFLRRIEAPTLLIMAEESWAVPGSMIDARAACIRRLERVVLPGAHHLHLDQPLGVARALRAFLGLGPPTAFGTPL